MITVGRKPVSEAMMNLPLIPEETPIAQVYSIPRAADVFGVSFKTLYNAVGDGRLPAYRLPTMGNRQEEKGVLKADVERLRATLRPYKDVR